MAATIHDSMTIILAEAYRGGDGFKAFHLLDQIDLNHQPGPNDVSIIAFAMACTKLARDYVYDHAPTPEDGAYDCIVDFVRANWHVLGHTDLSCLKKYTNARKTQGVDIGYGDALLQKQAFEIKLHFEWTEYSMLVDVKAELQKFETRWFSQVTANLLHHCNLLIACVAYLKPAEAAMYCQDPHCYQPLCTLHK